MRFTSIDAARATGGEQIGPAAELSGAAIDSRLVRPGQLFVPVVAERDGHDFVPAALEAGAGAYLTSRPPAELDATAIQVDDTAQALLDLGRFARAALPDRVVGVTGSVGKTSTKDLLSAVLATTLVTHANERSFNNELGVPLTLLAAPEATEVVVIEMGARGVGHIDLLCDVARPTVGVVTVVEGAHLELFGSHEGVAEAKGELIASIPVHGTAVLNADDHRVAAMAARAEASVLRFGVESHTVDVRAEHVELDEHLRPMFLLRTSWGTAHVHLGVRGLHQVVNALAAAACALALEVPLDAVAEGLAAGVLSPMRMELVQLPSGARLLNDAYNANPASTAAALRALAALRADRYTAVLGVMAELGAEGAAEHERVAQLAESLGIDVVAVDTPEYGPTAHHVHGIDAAVEVARSRASSPHHALLVKGSRVAALERVVAALTP